MINLLNFPFKAGDKVFTIHGDGVLINVNPLVLRTKSCQSVKISRSQIIGLDYYYITSRGDTMKVLDIPYVYCKNIVKKYGYTKNSRLREEEIIYWLAYETTVKNKSKIKNKLK